MDVNPSRVMLMKNKEKKEKVFQVQCPCCSASLWIDPISQVVLKSEKAKKVKGSLDELLDKEKKRQDEFGRKFEATAELEKEKKKKAQQKFEKAFLNIDEDD